MIDRTVAKDGIGWLLIGAAALLVGAMASASDAGWARPVLVIGGLVAVVALLSLAYEFLRRD